MPYTTRCLVWLSLILLCACAPNVVVDYDKRTDFSHYRTYRWGQGIPATNPNVDRLIVEAIDEQLAEKGLTKTDADPDLQVTYEAATHEEISESMYASGAGPEYASPLSPSALDAPMRVKVGTVVVDMYDTKQKHKVWRGVGSDVLRDNPAKTAKEIRRGAVKMFENFPPRR